MIIPTKKLKSGFSMPVYGLGTWAMHYTQEDIQAIKTAIEFGITHIDTAEIYDSEEAVGEAIKDFDRSKLFLVSKVYKNHLSHNDLIGACKDSLKRLKTDYLDLYLTHRYNPPDIPIEETMDAMNYLVEKGFVRNIGVCNYTVKQFQKAQSISLGKLVGNQLHLSLRFREAERKGLLKYCQENDVLFIAWSPIKRIFIHGVPDIVRELSEKHGKAPNQIALSWLISQDNIVTLSKTTNIEHLYENLGAIGWKMDKEDIERLRTDFPNQEETSDTVPLSD